MEGLGLLEFAERERAAALARLPESSRGQMGQFFTPIEAAKLIASMPASPHSAKIRILDPGAGSGVLSSAIVQRLLAESPELQIEIVAVEKDPLIVPYLEATLNKCESVGRGRVATKAVQADFILDFAGIEKKLDLGTFDLVIQNPPYGKLAVNSMERRLLRATCVDAPNLYAAFLALSIGLLRTGGQLVAITPRSFFNGPYFIDFRNYFLDSVALNRIHVFSSRSAVFADGGVLQENVIFTATRDGLRSSVEITESQDQNSEIHSRRSPYDKVVFPADPNNFIRLVGTDEIAILAEEMLSQPRTLSDIGVQVSTGKVVDFRSRSALHEEEVSGAVPLVYPGNLRDGKVNWPLAIKKPQWFHPADVSANSLLLPEGWYTVVKRFSAKEEKRRIVAAIWSPEEYPGAVAFENHLNVFHIGGRGLDRELAAGLSVWLNSDLVDKYFRTFSGHTQVNATDLRTLRFPEIETLRSFGNPNGIHISNVTSQGLAA
jgi:adenine-specific DNA-methyltransferase